MTIKDGAYYPLGCSEDMSEGEYQAATYYEDPVGDGSLNAPVGQWRTRDGRLLPIATMETKHLENAILYFTRAGWSTHEKIGELREELARRSR